ncbi:MAG: KdsC family phosphatase [Candidatus Zhuqueibacterota bacterium]
MQKVRVLLLDVDGVLTDGSVILGSGGAELKVFNIHDGLAIRLASAAGIHVGIITSRSSEAVTQRAAELGIEIVHQGAKDKSVAYQTILEELQASDDAVCYVGDDLPDWSLIKKAGVGVAVADACEEVKQIAAYVTTRHGGQGAVREVVEMILKSQGLWDDVIQPYTI